VEQSGIGTGSFSEFFCFPCQYLSTVALHVVDFDRVRLRLWTAATNGHIVHSQDDMSTENDGGMTMTG
jgi:hypothetical protein